MPFGGAGFDGSGWSLELVMKLPTLVQDLNSCLILLQDAANSWLTIVWDNTFDSNEVDSSNRLQATVVNNVQGLGLPTAAGRGQLEFFAPNNGTWYHVVWTLAPSGTSGMAVWSMYINGVLLNWANALVPSSTLTPIQGANFLRPATARSPTWARTATPTASPSPSTPSASTTTCSSLRPSRHSPERTGSPPLPSPLPPRTRMRPPRRPRP